MGMWTKKEQMRTKRSPKITSGELYRLNMFLHGRRLNAESLLQQLHKPTQELVLVLEARDQ
jgi:hypothetical protein